MLTASRLSCLLILLGLVAGCGDSASSSATSDAKGPDPSKAGPVVDPWKEAIAQLRRAERNADGSLKPNSDATACRTILSRLNNDVKDLDKSAPAAAATLAAVKTVVPLTARDDEEIQTPTFTPLDSAYLAECLYLRDAARAMELDAEPPTRRAQAAFAWVCRQVALETRLAAALPPTIVLPRGSGSAIERSYAFLALLQQLGIDGCLVGLPDSGEKPSGFVPPDTAKTRPSPTGPFWAVGARVGADILLFDPWRGVQFPGTLKEAIANPDLFKEWYGDHRGAWPLTPEIVKSATVFLASPISSQAERMKLLESKLQGEFGVRLSVDPVALRDRFQKEAGVKAEFWAPVRDRFDYSHTLAYNLPEARGGWDPTPDGPTQLFIAARIAELPHIDPQRLPELAGAERKLVERLIGNSRMKFDAMFLNPPTPRERLQRGQFQETSRALVETQDAFQSGLELARRDRSQVQPWVVQVNELYRAFERTRLDSDPVAQNEVNNRIERHWQNGSPVPQILIDSLVAPVGLAEAAYLLALCKHEMAERTQLRADRASGLNRERQQTEAREAWEVARDTWVSYDSRSQNGDQSPGRLTHAKTLTERATTMLGLK